MLNISKNVLKKLFLTVTFEGFYVKLNSCARATVMEGNFLFKVTDSSLLTPRT